MLQAPEYQLTPEDANRASNIEKDFVRVGINTLPQLGEVVIVEDPAKGIQHYMIEHSYNNPQLFEREVAFAKRRKLANSPFLNRYIDFTTSYSKGRGGGWIRHFAEIPKKILGGLVDTRDPALSTSIFMTELLYQMIDAGAALQDVGLAHGNISADYISFKEPCNFKLVDNFTSLGSLEDIRQRIVSKTHRYVSPEVFQKVMSNESLERINIIKHDVFCLGLLLLQMGTGCSIKDVYNFDGTFNRSKFKVLQDDFVNHYRSQENRLLAYTVIENMLDIDHNSRLDFKGLKKKLPPLKDVARYFQEEYHLEPGMSCLEFPDLEYEHLQNSRAEGNHCVISIAEITAG
jgi:hypothetical protein